VTAHRAARSWQDPEALALYRYLVETGAWWDYVDLVAADRVGPILLRHRPNVTPMMRSDAVADHLWVRRTAILAQLKHRQETDLDLLADVIDANLEGSRFGREFFVRKAIGWALRQHARVDPQWVRAFVEARGDRLSGLSRREALKHL
jgi:3-methyladenine DNA glycosylase AlkD